MKIYLLASLLVGLVSGATLPLNYAIPEAASDHGGEDYGKGDVGYGGSDYGKGDVKYGGSDYEKGDVKYGGEDYGKGDVKYGGSEYGGEDYGKGDVKYGGSDYGGEDYGKGDAGYGGSTYGDKKCYPTYETKYRDACEDYSEKVCYTAQKERCNDVPGQKCKAIQTSKQERKCFDVDEMLCSLKESVKYEEIPAVFTIQKCHKITERVCDTVYETEFTEKDDFKCITITNPWCGTKDYPVYDKTCRTMTHFDCKASGYADYDGHGSGESDSYGDSYNAGSYGKDSSSYDYKCTRTPETKCYTTPRTVSAQYCEDREEKVCEKLTELVPFPVEKQNCHDEHKKVCELEQRSQPKQIKKYVYTKHCRPVPKTVCDNADQKYLQPSCVASSRKKCSYYPDESCEGVPKQHCYKIPYQVKKMVCTKEYGGDQGSYKAQEMSYPEVY